MNTLLSILHVAQHKGLDRLDAQMLLLHALQKSTNDRAWLVAHDLDVLTTEQHQHFESLVLRRMQGEPVAYLLGCKEFFGLNLAVTRDVLVPRPDTECLVEWALECIPLTLAHLSEGGAAKTCAVLDLGTGSGAIGLAIKSERPESDVTLLDASQAALAVTLGNAASLGLAVRGLQSDWFSHLTAGQDRFDVIVSNPPYIAEGDAHMAALGHEPAMALTSGADGLEAIRRIVQDAPQYLKANGWLLLEHGYDQADAVRGLLTAHGFAQVTSRHDLNGIERCSGGTLK
jgi:release factor glutamine methyltransferase